MTYYHADQYQSTLNQLRLKHICNKGTKIITQLKINHQAYNISTKTKERCARAHHSLFEQKPKEGLRVCYLWSTTLILDHHKLLSWFSLIIFLQLFFGLSAPLLHSKRLIISHLLTIAFSLLFLTWPSHLSLVFLNLSFVRATPTFDLSNHCIPDVVQACVAAHLTDYSHISNHHSLRLEPSWLVNTLPHISRMVGATPHCACYTVHLIRHYFNHNH